MSNNDNKKNEILKRVYKLINEGAGKWHLEVDGEEADEIFEEIKKMMESGEVA
jgi:hypothetical protein